VKRIFLLPIIVWIIAGCWCSQSLKAETPAAPVSSPKPAAPGVEMAQALSTITGVAISPLLGASAVGAWKYYATNGQTARDKLPWYAQPWFWFPAFVIVGICALKDTFGMAAPAPLKKPFDVLETIEHKVSGLVAIGAFVPLVASVFHSAGANVPASLSTASNGPGFLAAIQVSWLYNSISIPVMMLVFLVVFLASNAINILILLSPFPVVDAVLKSFRLLVLSSVVAAAVLNPWLGALWSLCIIVIAWFISGWSLRLSHFGMAFIWDFCTRRQLRFMPDKSGNWMFLARKNMNAPIRTYGRLARDIQGNLVFHYRPWFVLPERTLTLPTGNYAVGKGLLYSEIVKMKADSSRPVFLLPPRYRTHEPELAQIYGFSRVRDSGLRAAFAWLKAWIGFKPKPQLITI